MNWVQLNQYSQGLTVKPGYGYVVDTCNSAVLVKLPKDVNIGDKVSFCDGFSSFGVHNLIIDGNGYVFYGNVFSSPVSQLICDVPNMMLNLIFAGSCWAIVSGGDSFNDSSLSIAKSNMDVLRIAAFVGDEPKRGTVGGGVRVIQL